ncbi:hypothetical protein N7495_005193 [Penicillium taxi]|uniref:uncharacterized protein n=1 Tax=Penicillium taxi TaxID=168475 RepID=UPI002545BBB4|nr:uncharacterized protein N7495_005193 [Penicillium taxi]KAJ5893502.1 hypothetical protein N7495_005193 [Penicillium taxi]
MCSTRDWELLFQITNFVFLPQVKRTIRLVTEQHIIDKPSDVEGFPLRSWSIEIYVVNERGADVPATLFDSVTYHLHPSFGSRATQVVKNPPFRIQEEGWGEFDMRIEFNTPDKPHTINHDLNFQVERYESKHVITFKNPKGAFLNALRETGPVGDENGAKAKRSGGDEGVVKKKKKPGFSATLDMDKLADGLMKLNEDDLLQVVQMVHDNKTPESYTKNDLELGEFHVDLYTLPDSLLKMLWDFAESRHTI